MAATSSICSSATASATRRFPIRPAAPLIPTLSLFMTLNHSRISCPDFADLNRPWLVEVRRQGVVRESMTRGVASQVGGLVGRLNRLWSGFVLVPTYS